MSTSGNGASRTFAPVHVVTACAEYRSRAVAGRQGVAVRTGVGVWAEYHRRGGPKWSSLRGPTLRSCPAFWEWVRGLCAAGRRVWLVAPSAADLLTVSGFWHHLGGPDWRIVERPPTVPPSPGVAPDKGKLWAGDHCLTGKVDIVSARTAGGSMLAVSLTNWIERDWPAVAREVGHSLPSIEVDTRGAARLEPTARDQAEITARWFRTFVSSWVESGYGTFGKTAGQMAVNIWRTVDGPRAARRHFDTEARELEAYACFGGRAAVNYVGLTCDAATDPDSLPLPPQARRYGVVPSAVERWDVRSQYPTLLGSEIYPVQLCGLYHDPSPAECLDCMTRWCCIASVTLDTPVPEYPVRTSGSTCYPVGTYCTVLAGPELHAALTSGIVRRAHRLLRYKPGRPFSGWASTVLGERRRARERGDLASERLWKAISTAFGGKFAQRGSRWVADPRRVPPVEWGEWLESPAAGRVPGRYRAFAGLTLRWIAGLPGGRLPAAIFVYLTSHGRTQMRTIRGVLPPRHWLSQDTDGLWCRADTSGLLESAGVRCGEQPGCLRLSDRGSWAWHITPRHYVVDGRWTLSGYCDGYRIEGLDRVRERHVINPVRSNARRAPRVLYESVRTIDLPSLSPGTPIGPDGWAHPIILGPKSAPYLQPEPVPFAPSVLPGC